MIGAAPLDPLLGFYLRAFCACVSRRALHAIRQTLARRCERVETTRRALAPPETANEQDRDDAVAGDGEDDEVVVGELLRDRTPDDLAWELRAEPAARSF